MASRAKLLFLISAQFSVYLACAEQLSNFEVPYVLLETNQDGHIWIKTFRPTDIEFTSTGYWNGSEITFDGYAKLYSSTERARMNSSLAQFHYLNVLAYCRVLKNSDLIKKVTDQLLEQISPKTQTTKWENTPACCKLAVIIPPSSDQEEFQILCSATNNNTESSEHQTTAQSQSDT